MHLTNLKAIEHVGDYTFFFQIQRKVDRAVLVSVHVSRGTKGVRSFKSEYIKGDRLGIDIARELYKDALGVDQSLSDCAHLANLIDQFK